MNARSHVPRFQRMNRVLPALLCLLGLIAALALGRQAQAAEAPPSWRHLSPAQQHILSPLQADWRQFDHDRKKKWLDIAARYPAMSAEQQQTLQQRMNEWAHLSPEKRRIARENFLSTGKSPQQRRREAWDAYKKLPEKERERLKEEARHPKPHPGQVGKFIQERHNGAQHPVPAKAAAPLPAAAAKPSPAPAQPSSRPAY